jgi:hypothetical protein
MKQLFFWGDPQASLTFNGFILLLFLALNIHKLVHPMGNGIYFYYSRLKLGWLIFTLILGVFFSPGLLPLFLVLKIGNYNDKDTVGYYKGRGVLSYFANETFTRKFRLFYVDEICEGENAPLFIDGKEDLWY